MNFQRTHTDRPSVAIIGGGISGMACAYQLADDANITLYESEDRLGGHAYTVTHGINGQQAVDMGFIVFNFANYPHLTRMFQALDVPIEKSNMSFGVTIDNGRIEYALDGLKKLFAQKRNIINPKMWRMIFDILKFGKFAYHNEIDDHTTIGELMKKLGMGEWFVNHYLLPISGAIWSSTPAQIEKFPAKSLVQFFINHGLLEAGKQHQWWTVSGGSISYVNRLTSHLAQKSVTLKTSTPIEAVRPSERGVEVHIKGFAPKRFDHVIFACHSDDASRALGTSHPQATKLLDQIEYQDNRVILHKDANQMPRNKNCWSSWVYQSGGKGGDGRIGVTYWMNRLQNIPENDPLFVTLNPVTNIDPHKIYEERIFRHPIFDQKAVASQHLMREVQGAKGIWFAGAYLRHGFHEDGFASAVRVANALKETIAERAMP